jgi:uncharacterized protein YqgV (UPF0045/DUF77 family)
MKAGRWTISTRKQNGGSMQTTIETKNIDQLLAEADELIQQIHSDAIKDMEEAHRIQFKKHARRLKDLRFEHQQKTVKGGTPEKGAYAEGMHDAILDIITAMKNFASDLS